MWEALALLPGVDAEACRSAIADEILEPTYGLDVSMMLSSQTHWDREQQFEQMLALDPSPCITSLQFIRSGLKGRVIGYREVVADAVKRGEEAIDMSLQRPLASKQNYVRGSLTSTPFRPGGLQDVDEENEDIEEDDSSQMPGTGDVRFRTVPPGFSRGLNVTAPEFLDTGAPAWMGDVQDVAPRFLDRHVITVDDDGLYKRPDVAPPPKNDDAKVDELLPDEYLPRLFQDSVARPTQEKREWAHMVDSSKKMSNFHELVPQMAHEYPFELDTFQKQAVYHLERNDSVFVAAHTSAGKTVVAEYAIALAMKHMSRCIYTSPIKALSNQKFREFKQAFGAENVGIVTGDVKINPEAACLIMTTEVLRSMLYRAAELIRDVEFVIFDEVHYVNDQERGVVWEEVIILLPAHVNTVLLSATVPNTQEFADWVGRTRRRDVYVISTPKRPVPLEHFLYAGKQLHKIVDANGRFLSKGVNEAADALLSKKEREAAYTTGSSAQRGHRGGRGGGPAGRSGGAVGRGGSNSSAGGGVGRPRPSMASDRSLWVNIVGLLKKQSLLPVVVFVFSKKKCEEYADSLPKTDLSTAKEKSEVHVLIERSLMRLKEEDRQVPQIARMRDLLSRGIGVHHSGLLPIVKELVELLFQRTLVKVLFATETFAMGVNMPARSVVFSGVRKNDGNKFRNLLPGEYTQMAGRAGRRGLDKTGVVIILSDNPELNPLNRMILGESTKLKSQFRITYCMILNLLRIETLKVEDMIKRSFSENAAQKLMPQHQGRLKNLEHKLHARRKRLESSASLPIDALSRLYDLSNKLVRVNDNLLALAYEHPQGAKLFSSGRVILVYTGTHILSPAMIVRLAPNKKFLVLLAVLPDQQPLEKHQTPFWVTSKLAKDMARDSEYMPELQEVSLSKIAFVSSFSVPIPATLFQSRRQAKLQQGLDLLRPSIVQIRNHLEAAGDEAARAILDLEADWSRVRRIDFQDTQKDRNQILSELIPEQGLMQEPSFDKEFKLLTICKLTEWEMAKVSASLSNQNLELLPDYHQRVDVLKELRFIDPESETVMLKGRIACGIRSVNELIMTELILDNTFVDYEPHEIAALLSVFHFRENTSMTPELNDTLQRGLDHISKTADRIAAVQMAHHLQPEDDASTLHTGLVEVVYEWTRGLHFSDIMQLTDVGEGTIVRCITRLDETFREVRECASVIGNAPLYQKMETCQQLVRRDIVFAASLYF